jgi:hypothetical protein
MMAAACWQAHGRGASRSRSPEIFSPVQPTWTPTREFERAVFATLILAGEPVNNRRLAELMDCSPGEASRRVAQLEGVIRQARKGREVLISLH